MTKEKIQKFFKSKFVILALVYAFVFLVSSYFKYLEILLIPIMLYAFIVLDIEQGFYFFLYTQPFYVSQFLRRPAIIAEVVFMAILLIKFIIGVKNKKYKLYKKLGILIAAFTGYTLFVSLFHKMAAYSIAYIFYLPIFYIVFCTRHEYSLEKITRVVAYSLIFSCIVSLGMLPITTRETCYRIVDGAFRFRGFYGSANTLYMTALLGLSCYMYLYFKNKVEFKEYIIMFFVLAGLSLSTSSKANIVILALLTLISVICYLIKDFKKRIWQILIAAGMVLLVLIIFKDFTMSLVSRFLNVDSGNFLNSLSTGRMDIWSAYVKEIFENPFDCLFGHGMLSKYAYVPEQGRDRAQHNLYIFLLYKFGIIGILFLFLIMWQFVKDSGKTRPMFINLIPLIYFLVGAMVDNSFMYPQYYIIVAFVLFNTTNKVVEQKATQMETKKLVAENEIEKEKKE
ncbi:MAG: O-antigen ligase family protein [Clostridia bacterium]|nr:O-antigen ligase family protein [Clostridia bacterium]